MAHQIEIDPSAKVEHFIDDGTNELVKDVAYQRLAIVNAVYFGDPAGQPWVVIDTGVKGMVGRIRKVAAKRFGSPKPAAIILTHGHADHVGSLVDLLQDWDVPVYAHKLELPYLDGRASYPPADPTVGGGMMSVFSKLFSRGPINVTRWLNELPDDRSVPFMPGFRWIHTPGHTPGHISLWREADGLLIAGDAFITTNQESAFAVAIQRPELHGPPMYYTSDWKAARESVRLLASLEPQMVITGHGRAMQGEKMLVALKNLSEHFDAVAVPQQGRYVVEPARADADGPTYIPPKP